MRQRLRKVTGITQTRDERAPCPDYGGQPSPGSGPRGLFHIQPAVKTVETDPEMTPAQGGSGGL